MIKTMMTTVAASLLATTAFAGTYKVTVTNNLKNESLAPILITDADNDNQIFKGSYVTDAAEEQILTGDPARLAKRIAAHAHKGHSASVAHGNDGPPGLFIAPGKSFSFIINTEAESVRVLAMVVPTETPDNYVTTVVNLKGDSMMSDNMGSDNMAHDDNMGSDNMAHDDNMGSDSMAHDDNMGSDNMMAHGGVDTTVGLDRYDIGNDEGTKTITPVAANVATIKIVEKQ